MRVLEILLSKSQKDKDLSSAEKQQTDNIQKKITHYREVLKDPKITTKDRALFQKKLRQAVDEVKQLSENGVPSMMPAAKLVQYEIYDIRDGQKIGKNCTTRTGARRAVDRLDNEYGGYRYRYRIAGCSPPLSENTKLSEVMQGTNEYEIEEDTNRIFVVSFWVGEIPYLYRALNNKGNGLWIIEFIDNSRSDSDMYKITGTGNASQVMGTVLNITQQFLETHADDVVAISFMAKESRRDSLYKKIAAKFLPDWTMEQKGVILTYTKPKKHVAEPASVMEAVHKVPLIEEDFDFIKELMEKPIPAVLAQMYLSEVIVDDELTDVLQLLSETEPNRDVRQLVAEWIDRVMPDQMYRFTGEERDPRQMLGILSPIHGYDPKVRSRS
jgi:hypothetical protein